jgi:ATP-dependent DNA ligase
VPVDEREYVHLRNDHRYGAQEKVDGERTGLAIDDQGRAVASNRLGLERAMPQAVVEAARQVAGRGIHLDGVMQDGIYHVFDLLVQEGRPIETRDYLVRWTALREVIGRPLVSGIGPGRPVRLVELALTFDDKFQLSQRVANEEGEGLCLKLLSAPYTHGRDRLGAAFKYHLRPQCSVIVGGTSRGRRAIEMEMLEADGKRLRVGELRVPDTGSILPGTVVDIWYRQIKEGGTFTEPVFKAVRTDVLPTECTIDQVVRLERRKSPVRQARL